MRLRVSRFVLLLIRAKAETLLQEKNRELNVVARERDALKRENLELVILTLVHV